MKDHECYIQNLCDLFQFGIERSKTEFKNQAKCFFDLEKKTFYYFYKNNCFKKIALNYIEYIFL